MSSSRSPRRRGFAPSPVLGSPFTLAELADKTNYSIGHLSRVVRRVQPPSPTCLDILARALERDPAVLARQLLPPRTRGRQRKD